MMNSNIGTAVCVVVILLVGSFVWNRIFVSYLKKSETGKAKSGDVKKKTFSTFLKPAGSLANLFVMCSVLLSNTDDDVSDALDYIRPSKRLDHLLEKVNEQAGISKAVE